MPVNDQVLMCGAKALQGEETLLTDLGVERGATVHLSCRLRGGKPVKVKMMTNHLPCGSEVTIDLEPNATKNEIKRKLEVATGVPVEHQKVMLSGINQITMGDKRYDFIVIYFQLAEISNYINPENFEKSCSQRLISKSMFLSQDEPAI